MEIFWMSMLVLGGFDWVGKDVDLGSYNAKLEEGSHHLPPETLKTRVQTDNDRNLKRSLFEKEQTSATNIWEVPKMVVPNNHGFSMVFPLKLIILKCFGGTPIFGNTHLFGGVHIGVRGLLEFELLWSIFGRFFFGWCYFICESSA